MKIAQSSRPGVEVVIHDHAPHKIYTTFDAVTGVVKVTAPQNVRFDEIKITLEGRSKTFVENFSAAGTRSRSVARHTFLRLNMPVSESSYPQPRVAEAGFTYSFPFNVSLSIYNLDMLEDSSNPHFTMRSDTIRSSTSQSSFSLALVGTRFSPPTSSKPICNSHPPWVIRMFLREMTSLQI